MAEAKKTTKKAPAKKAAPKRPPLVKMTKDGCELSVNVRLVEEHIGLGWQVAER